MTEITKLVASYMSGPVPASPPDMHVYTKEFLEETLRKRPYVKVMTEVKDRIEPYTIETFHESVASALASAGDSWKGWDRFEIWHFASGRLITYGNRSDVGVIPRYGRARME